MSLPGLTPTRSTRNEAAAVAAGVKVDLRALLDLRLPAEGLSLTSMHVAAQESGALRSPFRGRGMEYEESRPYQPGDDLRTLDWRVTARTGKPFTKLFREERERPVLLCVDLRRSMHFATHGAFKSVVAARVAALLAWSALKHGDRLGGLVYSETGDSELRPQRGKAAVLRFLDALCTHPGWDAIGAGTSSEGFVPALVKLRRVARPGSLIFICSDFRDVGTGAEAQLARLAGHSDVVMIMIYDSVERDLPPPDLYRVQHDERTLLVDARRESSRERYHERFEQRMKALRGLARRYRIHFMPCETGADAVATLRAGLGLKPGQRRPVA